jgi:hypothetical protein
MICDLSSHNTYGECRLPAAWTVGDTGSSEKVPRVGYSHYLR